MPSRHATVAALAAVALAAAACGDDDDQEAAAPAKTPTPAPTAAATPDPSLRDTDSKPVIAKPTGDPPTELEVDDIVRGKGRRAREGDDVTVQYVGASFSTGQEFDASWDRGEPFTFALGTDNVIPGWHQGVAGMRVGGRRKLTIPPDLAYGAAGSPPAIAPNETLVFVIDLQRID